MNQRKCSKCSHWNPAHLSSCSQCNSLIDPVVIAAEEFKIHAQIRAEEAKARETKFEKWLHRIRTSQNPVARLLYFVLSTILTIYMAFVSFFIWLIALISG